MMLFRGNMLTWVLAGVEAVLLYILITAQETTPLSVIFAVAALILPSVIGWFSGSVQTAVTFAVLPYWVVTIVYFLLAKSPTPVIVGSQQEAAGLAFGLLLYAVLGWLGHQARGGLNLGGRR